MTNACLLTLQFSYLISFTWSFEPRHGKTNKMSVRPAKTQISIRPDWSESSLYTQWVAKGPRFLHAHREDSDQTGRMPKLIWVFAGRTLILLVLSYRGSFSPFVYWYKLITSTTIIETNWASWRENMSSGFATRYDNGLRSHRDKLEAWNFGDSKQRYYTIQAVNDKGADQTGRVRRLICAFVVRIWHKQGFSWRGSTEWWKLPALRWKRHTGNRV